MAFPVISFDRDGGHDGNDASGAGPSTAIKGTKARTKSGGLTRIGFFETSAPDLSGIAVDGSHALKLGTGAGRQWTRILGKKDTQQSQSGSMSSGTAVVTSLTDTSAMSVGDNFVVPEAAGVGVPLYSSILTVDSGTQVTLTNSASNTATGVTCVCPKNLTVEDSFALTADTAWAVGDKRGDPMQATQLPLDVKAGWTIDLQRGPVPQDYDFTSAWVLVVSGDSTNGRITIKATPGADGVKPRITATSSISPLTIRGDLYTVRGFDFDDVDTLVLADNDAADNLVIEDCDSNAATGINGVLRVTSAVTDGRFTVRGGNLLGGAGDLFIEILGAAEDLVVDGCFFYGGAPASAIGIDITTRTRLTCEDSIFYRLAAGISGGTSTVRRANRVMRNTFDTTAKGIEFSTVGFWWHAVVRGNTFTNCSGFGIEGVAGADQVKDQVDFNNFFANNQNLSNVSAGANDTALDPDFRDPAGFDFRPGLSLRGTGFPRTVAGVLTAVDIGAMQRREPVGGNVLKRIVAVVDTGPDHEVQYDNVGGPSDGAREAVLISKTLDPIETVKHSAAAYFRDGGAAAALVGQEVAA